MAAFKIHEIRELIRLIDESQIEWFEIDNEGAKIIIKKSNTNKASASIVPKSEIDLAENQPIIEQKQSSLHMDQSASDSIFQLNNEVTTEENLQKIVSPMVGTFYHAPSPDAEPYIKEGDQVTEKTIVCIIEAMKLMNELEAETRGMVVKILVKNGELVQYGQPLFLIKTT